MLSCARLRAPFCVAGAALLRWLANVVAGAEFPASGCAFVWCGQRLGTCLKALDVVGVRLRGMGSTKATHVGFCSSFFLPSLCSFFFMVCLSSLFRSFSFFMFGFFACVLSTHLVCQALATCPYRYLLI